MGDYRSPAVGDLGEVKRRLGDLERQLREEGRASGTQTADALATLTELVNNLQQEIEDVSASGATWQGPVSSGSGSITTTSGYIFTPAGYAYDITYTRHTAWLGNDGRLGWASSSIEKKDLVDDVDLPDPRTILEIADTYYVYKAEVAKRDDPTNPEYDPEYRVHLEYGHIAEWIHELGLWQAVAYDPAGKPIGVHDNVLAGFALRAARFIWHEHLSLEARVRAIEAAQGL